MKEKEKGNIEFLHSYFICPIFSRDNQWALLQLFCSVAKSYIDGEMESWRKFQKMKAKDAFNGYLYISNENNYNLITEMHHFHQIQEWRRYRPLNMFSLNVQLYSLLLYHSLILYLRYHIFIFFH